MNCGRMLLGVLLADLGVPLYCDLVSWMATVIERRDPNSFIGFVGWSAFFFYLGCRGIVKVTGLGIDKKAVLK